MKISGYKYINMPDFSCEIFVFNCNVCNKSWDDYECERKIRLKNVLYVILKYVKHVSIVLKINNIVVHVLFI